MTVAIVPAHNEQAVIGRCLKGLLDAGEGTSVVVVPNGTTDRTAEIARSFGPTVTVIETDVPSKSNALNVGDAAADGFPRFYVDADIVMDGHALERVAEALREPGILAAAPQMHVDVSERSWPVRAYYAVWLQMPYSRSGMIGSGVYALNEEGRKRFDKFPNITADDAFVRLHFAPHERKTVDGCTFTVTPPKTLAKIIDIKTRSHFGNEELRQKFPELWKNEEAQHKGPLLKLALNPLWWPALAVYGYVKLAVRRRVRERFRRGEIHKWERDDSSREPAQSPSATAAR